MFSDFLLYGCHTVRVVSISVSSNLNADVGTVRISSGVNALLRCVCHRCCPIGSYAGFVHAFYLAEKESESG